MKEKNVKYSPLTPKELIDLIVSAKPTAEDENDEDMYPSPQGEIEVDLVAENGLK